MQNKKHVVKIQRIDFSLSFRILKVTHTHTLKEIKVGYSMYTKQKYA